MSGRRWRWTSVARGFALAALAVLLVVVAAFVVDRLGRKPRMIDNPPGEIGPAKVEVRNQVSFIEFRGDQSKVEARADKQYKGADGRNHLEGRVQIVDYGKTGGREIRMAGEAAVYDEGWTRIEVRGNAAVRMNNLAVVSLEFAYDKSTETVRSSAGVRLVSPRFGGTARSLAYDFGSDVVVFEDEVDFTVALRDPSQAPIRLTGQRFLYNQRDRVGRIEGDVVFSQKENRGRAGIVQFELFPDSDNLSRVELREGVDLRVENPAASSPSKPPASTAEAGFTDFISFWADRYRITAGQAILIPFPDSDLLQAFLLREGGAVKFLFDSGNETDVSGERVEFFFTPEGELRDFSVEGRPRIAGFRAATKETKILEGDRVFYEDRDLRLTGSPDRPATFVEPGRTLTCGTLVFYFRLNSFDAAGGVSIVSTPKEGGGGIAGFFRGTQPVFIRAEAARYEGAERSFWMDGPIRIVQGRESLFVRELKIFEDTGEIREAKAPLSTFIHVPRNRDNPQEERMTIEAATLNYDPAAQKIVYGGAGILRTRDVEIRAEAITVDLAGGEIRRVLASRQVTLFQGGGAREATGGLAVYDAAAETIVLTERPVLKEKGKGSASGEKLTFFLADGKIVVENRDGGQAAEPQGRPPR